MTKVGITGHQRLPSPMDWDWVSAQLNATIARVPPPVVAISSLAIGADQLFAEAVLTAGGTLEAIIPFDEYVDTFQNGDRVKFRKLRELSCRVEVLARVGSDEECYFAAGKRVVDLSDLVVAVWNGKPAEGLGGTADIVRYAVGQGKRVIHINPTDRTVTES
jgi:hypothetical protein